jgi:hypothetical protein
MYTYEIYYFDNNDHSKRVGKEIEGDSFEEIFAEIKDIEKDNTILSITNTTVVIL